MGQRGNVLLCIMFLFWHTCNGGKILIVPMEGSHWVNMDILIKALHAQGHAVSVVRTTKSWYVQEDSTFYNAITVPVKEAFNHDFMNSILEKVMAIHRGDASFMTFGALQSMYNMHQINCDMATAMFTNKTLLKSLNEAEYDMVLTDPAWGTGIMLSHYLKIPLVYNVRWVTSGEGHLAAAPSPLSYIPVTLSQLTDKMMFIQRVKNLLFYALWQAQDIFLIDPQYQAVCNQFFGSDVKYHHLLQGADLWLMRVDFVFEFPRPTMPNFVYMGGFQCQPAKALPQHLEDFVQSSGEHGVILMSMGTFINILPADVTNEIAAAFAKLPQKVIWKHTGDGPTNLGNNTLLVDGMPQNDLLGHPKMKLFVAHGGTNGLQEAIYHGIPVVGLPVFFDQFDNLVHLKERGGAQIVTINSVDKDKKFLKAVEEILNDPGYRMDMQRLSRLHRDQPIKPLDSALFWMEFMRHKGASHLRTQSYRMPWYSYYVDVALFMFSAILLVLTTVFILMRHLNFLMCKRQ